jgi:thiosulfate/3-mercaptopyruvate sulfurtransferase
LEPWEKVLVNNEKFAATIHGKQDCAACHAGQPAEADKDAAHSGLIASPSQDAANVCGTCHSEQAGSYATSLHNTQAGYWTVLNTRSVPENHAALETMFGNHCATCHTTCGECHVSQPKNVGGGLFDGHVFVETPPMTRSCTACHGSRVGNEFLGKNEGFPGDVHFRQGRMNCVKCHSGADLHGETAAAADHRYAGAEMPACTDCHTTEQLTSTGNVMHTTHGDQLACQVCHAITYTSCDGCHVAVSEKSGNPFFETEATYATFVIGRNPRQSAERPYEYVLLRHVPVATTSFQYYGENLLPNFDALPTWAYATPHNIQRNTPQTESCEACHGNADLFLTADKVKPAEQAANASVIVASLPSMSGSPDDGDDDGQPANGGIPLPPANHTGLIVCNVCHLVGAGDAPVNPPSHAGREDGSCTTCHPLPTE